MKKVGVIQPGEEKASGISYCSLSIYKRGLSERQRNTFHSAYSDRTRGNGFKMKEGWFKLDLRNTVFTVRVVRHWNSVAAPSLTMFRSILDGSSLRNN